MIKSMTGFGRGNLEEDGRSFTVEIKSVNHRYLDINIRMPKNLIAFESKIREMVKEKISRGKVDIFITLNSYKKEDIIAKFNQSIADSYVECLQEIKNKYDIKDDISVSLVAKFSEVITLEQSEEDEEKLWNSLLIPLSEAADLLLKMRKKEGIKLQKDVKEKCKYVKKLVCKIKERSPLVVEDYKKRLNLKLKQLIEDVKIDENRVAMEIAIFADKSCIDEEIVRLNSHLFQMEETLELNEPIGRKMDFIVQEMNREANTIASKSNDVEISNLVLEIKNQIEKIREQIQNIE